jgi:hypothetical protein
MKVLTATFQREPRRCLPVLSDPEHRTVNEPMRSRPALQLVAFDNPSSFQPSTRNNNTIMSSDNDQPQANPPEIDAAYKEARERGLPEGWTCSIDVSSQ